MSNQESTQTDDAERALRRGETVVLWRDLMVEVGTTCSNGHAEIPKGARIHVQMDGPDRAWIFGSDGRPLPKEDGDGACGLHEPVWEIAKHSVVPRRAVRPSRKTRFVDTGDL